MIFLFTYLKLALWTGIYSLKQNDIIFDIIVNNIKSSGPVLTKLIQWVLPKYEVFYEIDRNNKKHEWFYKLEEIYENCDFHSIEYTKHKYNQDFNLVFDEEYTSITEIASGSIGQVYKIKDKKENEFAMKILHPNIHQQINFFYYLFLLIKIIKPLHNYISYYFPIDLNTFIIDFKMQTDFINEANNNLAFTNIYQDNPHIIIPSLHKVSSNIIIMSYEEGTRFDKIDLSDDIVYKTVSLLKLFNKNNEVVFNFMHGDLHKGNWKIRINNGDVKLVIYDFGFCWRPPKAILDNLIMINHTLMDINVKETSSNREYVNIDGFTNVAYIFCEEKIRKEVIKHEVKKLIEKNMVIYEPFFLIQLLINCTRIEKKIINSYILGCIIFQNQMEKIYRLIIDVDFINDKKFNERKKYFQAFHELDKYCKENTIYIDYIEYIKNEIKIENEMKNISYQDLFSENKELEMNDTIKALCIQDD